MSRTESLINNLMKNYTICEKENSQVFRYKLNVTRDKILTGKFQFYVQVSLKKKSMVIVIDLNF